MTYCNDEKSAEYLDSIDSDYYSMMHPELINLNDEDLEMECKQGVATLSSKPIPDKI